MFEYAKALLDLYLPEKAEGQGLVEYALIIFLVSIAAVATLLLLGGRIAEVFGQIVTQLGGGGGGGGGS